MTKSPVADRVLARERKRARWLFVASGAVLAVNAAWCLITWSFHPLYRPLTGLTVALFAAGLIRDMWADGYARGHARGLMDTRSEKS